jgi:hypothetical protein
MNLVCHNQPICPQAYRSFDFSHPACPSFLYPVFLLLQTKQTPWPLVRERTIPTERPPLVDEI